jgi:hypothetical protein
MPSAPPSKSGCRSASGDGGTRPLQGDLTDRESRRLQAGSGRHHVVVPSCEELVRMWADGLCSRPIDRANARILLPRRARHQAVKAAFALA